MSATTSKPLPGSILVAVDGPALARWVVWLVEALRQRPGAQVYLRVEEKPCEASTALASLLGLEKMLVSRRLVAGGDRIPRSEIDGSFLEPAGFAPDVVIDLRASPSSDLAASAIRLRPLYDGHPGEQALVSALFFRETPQIAIEKMEAGQALGMIVATGTASLEAKSCIGSGMEAVTSRVITLLLKVLSGYAGEGLIASSIPVRPIGRKDVAVASVRDIAQQAARAMYRLCCYESHWRVGWRFVEPGQDVWSRGDLAGKRWNVLPDPVDHFYADPFPLHWRGRDYLFFEDLDHKVGKGVIAVAAFDDAGRPGQAVTVLEEPWHLSYPFLIERDGEVFMIPESSANREIVIYRASDFPLKWERHAVLVENVEAADATIVEHDGLFYMFAVTREGFGGYSDTLAIWWAEDLFGPWHPHRQNPVLVNDRTARPAGNFIRMNGGLFRPVQDCRRAYGADLGLMKVRQLDREGFVQEPHGRISAGGPEWPGKRIHSLNYNGRLETIDGYNRRPKLKLAADWVDWWSRPRG
ncbi:MAG: hypothetical protein KF810_19840 [Rhizobiaceae bacterium]|nr:hypothetical protein [Rhizobiaceae bacterium]